MISQRCLSDCATQHPCIPGNKSVQTGSLDWKGGLQFPNSTTDFTERFRNIPAYESKSIVFRFNRRCNLELHSLTASIRGTCRIHVVVSHSEKLGLLGAGKTAWNSLENCRISRQCWNHSISLPLKPFSLPGKFVTVKITSGGTCSIPFRQANQEIVWDGVTLQIKGLFA